MKKSVLALAMAFGVTSAFAQDLTSKKGEPILPEAGDWAISANATPFLNYMGNLFGKTADNNYLGNSSAFNFLGSQSLIMGKYFKDEKTAYRMGVNIGFNTQSATNLVNQNQFAGTGQNPMVTDKTSISNTGIGLTAGIEKRKGKTRLQGYYGAEAGIYIGSQHTKDTYGNQFGTGAAAGTSTDPTSTTWSGTTATGTVGAQTNGGRITDMKSGTTFQFGVRGFVGVEYFVLPKISLGGEFGWGIGISTTGAGQTTKEAVFPPSTTAASTETTKTGKSSAFVIGTDNKNSMFGPTGTLRANFYF